MEISFDNRNIKIFREIYCQTKQIQEAAESVVPDTDDDISKIALVQSSVLLKSKDITSRGVLICGEATASLMYITESQDKVSFVKLTKPFSMEFEIAEIDMDAVAQVKLNVLSADARVINPRKVSVNFSISADLCCFRPEELCVESALKSQTCPGLHAKYETAELNLITAVCEKTFAINEQFSFPGGKPRPARFVSANVDFAVNDSQFIGTKVIVKGSVDVAVCYLSDEVNYPVRTEFTTPFSQIVDVGEELTEGCTVLAELTGAYFDIADSINGDKLLDTELHAVLQLVCRSKKEMLYISDAYSNLMHASCSREKKAVHVLMESRKIKLTADERISVMDDCADVLSIFASVVRLSQEQSKLKAVVNIDLVYRTQSGQLSAVRRNMSMETDTGMYNYRLSGLRLNDVYFRPDGQYLDGHLSVELSCSSFSHIEIDKVISVELDEDNPVLLEEYPAVSLVRCSGESLWELAKTYHSSIEKISSYNDIEEELNGKMLLIPKSV